MTFRSPLALCAAATALAFPAQIFAQDAAETAVIMSGTSGQAKASRSLGSAVNKSLNSAASSVRASTANRSSGSSARRNRRAAPSVVSVIGTGDALEGTDASAYTVGSGATIKVSGSFRPSAASVCKDNCEDQPEAANTPEE